MTKADDLIEVMAKAIENCDPNNTTSHAEAVAILSALEAAGYVVGRMRWAMPSLQMQILYCGETPIAGVVMQINGTFSTQSFDSDAPGGLGYFDTLAEARAACEAAVRKAMRGE